MHYTGTIWRPPYEACSALIQVTAGCTHHKCKFCTLYEDVPFKFRMSPLSEVEADLKEMSRYYRNAKRVFFTGANPFVLSFDKLKTLAGLVRKYYPKVQSIGCFARITDITPKTTEQLRELREMEKWDACAFPVDEREVLGRGCYGGLDLSSSIDITAFVLVFPPRNDTEKYILLPYFWIPEDNMRLRVRRDHVPYDVWEKQGYLQTTEGNVIHYGFIENFIDDLGKKFHIKEIAFDRWGAVQMVQNLEGLGFTVVPFGQGFKDMSPPTKRLMELVLEKNIAHGGHPVLRWMMDNIFVRTDPAGNIKPDKEKSTEKIDGAVATIMGLDRAIRNEGSTGSVYDGRGILLL